MAASKSWIRSGLGAVLALCCMSATAGPVAGFEDECEPVEQCPLANAEDLRPVSTREVLNVFRHDQQVMLRGRIVCYVDEEAYEFRDESGTIILNLDRRHNWDHLIIGQEILVYGVVNRDWRHVSVRVHRAGSAAKAMIARK